MKKIKLGQQSRMSKKTKLINALHSASVNKISMFDNKKSILRINMHKVEVIFSRLRLEKKQEPCFYGVCYKFTNLLNCFIISICEYFAQKEVEYCYGGRRRTSMRILPLWTAYKTTGSHLSMMPGLFASQTSSAEFERGNARYIAKIRLMKGENA